MSDTVTGVIEKLGDLLPGQIGDNRRWSTAEVTRHIMFADRLIRERTENLYHEQEISLVAGTFEYALDNEFINVVSVEYASDGSTYDYYLTPIALDDLDKINMSWRSDGGTRPSYYTLLSAPGTNTTDATAQSRILVYPKMTSATTETIRVRGNSISTTSVDAQEATQSKCHVPHVMAVLLAKSDPQKAANWFGQYLNNVDEIRRMTKNRLLVPASNIRVGW